MEEKLVKQLRSCKTSPINHFINSASRKRGCKVWQSSSTTPQPEFFCWLRRLQRAQSQHETANPRSVNNKTRLQDGAPTVAGQFYGARCFLFQLFWGILLCNLCYSGLFTYPLELFLDFYRLSRRFQEATNNVFTDWLLNESFISSVLECRRMSGAAHSWGAS